MADERAGWAGGMVPFTPESWVAERRVDCRLGWSCADDLAAVSTEYRLGHKHHCDGSQQDDDEHRQQRQDAVQFDVRLRAAMAKPDAK